MNTLALSWRYLWSRPLAAALNLLLMTLGLASMTFVLLASHQLDQAFERDLAGIDAVVGAKGSPLQLILAGVFHIDVPPGNIPLAGVRQLEQHPQVAQVIPLSLGDSLRGFRIVGTTPAYLAHYQATRWARDRPGRGRWKRCWARRCPAVRASSPATASAATMAWAASGPEHAQAPYRVTGVLAPCGCVADRLVLTSLQSVWQVHDRPGTAEEPGHKEEKQVSMALISYKSPLSAVSFPRMVNTTTNMQAAAPAVEVSRLMGMLGVGTDVMKGLAGVLLVTAALSVFIALWNAVRERRADLAMLRMLGATPMRVAALLVCEALLLALMASVLGLLAGHGLTALAGWMLRTDQSVVVSGWQWVPVEAWVPAGAVAVAALAALLPALAAYRVDVARLLNAR
jgi:putative ABC transport system permease protein